VVLMAIKDVSVASPADGVSDFARPGPAVTGTADRHIIVVADRFAQFAVDDQVATMSELVSLLSSGTAGGHWVVHLGQGVEDSDCEILEYLVAGGSVAMSIANRDSFPRVPAVPGMVHKHFPENVVLADVRNPSKEHCLAELRIHKDNELILDHHTGEHVQGIVIIEAMRQICIAQFETGYRAGLPSYDYTGMWTRMNISFESFLFPLQATVESTIVEADLSRESNLKFRASTSVRQNGVLVASSDIEYAMVKQARIDTLERRKSAQAAQAQLAEFSE
jgi:hypothetical protein